MLKRLGLAFGVMLVVGFAGILACGSGEEGEEQQPKKDVVQPSKDTTEPGKDAATEQGQGGGGDVVTQDAPASEVRACVDECIEVGSTQCVGTTAMQTCQVDENGCLVWGEPVACPPGQECNPETGACAALTQPCVDECLTVGERSCSEDGTWVLECQEGPQGCKVLVQVESCEPPATCEDGACVGEVPTDCKELIFCIAACTTVQCQMGCVQNATPQGQAAYAAIQACVQEHCSEFADKPAALQACMIEKCGDAWTGCVGPWGTASCSQILMCATGCGNDAKCQVECLISGSQEGQIAILKVQVCIEEKCAPKCGQDQNCYMMCAQSECGAEILACTQS